MTSYYCCHFPGFLGSQLRDSQYVYIILYSSKLAVVLHQSVLYTVVRNDGYTLSQESGVKWYTTQILKYNLFPLVSSPHRLTELDFYNEREVGVFIESELKSDG